MKTKVCRICKKVYTPRRALQRVCGLSCSIEDVAQKNAKKARKKLREDKRRVRTNTQVGASAQQSFNTYIRIRDYHRVCISCGQSPYKGQRHSSHFRSRAAASQLRYHWANANASCAQCNSFKSGNIVPYRQALVKKYGEPVVEALECNNERRTFTREELERISAVYKRKARLYRKFRGI